MVSRAQPLKSPAIFYLCRSRVSSEVFPSAPPGCSPDTQWVDTRSETSGYSTFIWQVRTLMHRYQEQAFVYRRLLLGLLFTIVLSQPSIMSKKTGKKEVKLL